MKYKFLDSVATADIAFEAYGKDLNELFENAALAFSEATVNVNTMDMETSKIIELEHKDIDGLLFDFLDELVYLKDSEQLIFKKYMADVKANKKFNLHCKAFGEKIDYGKHELAHDVKAVTMHKFKVLKTNRGWKAMVILDI